MAVSVIDVQKAYLAYFGRPADPVGLAYWMNQDATTMRAGFGASTEYATLYSGMTQEQRVEQVYQNVFGRASDAAGKAYWVNEFTAGRETVSSLVASMQTNAIGADVGTIDNRVTYAIRFTDQLDTPGEVVAYSGTAAATAARDAVSVVTSTAASLNTATANIVADTSSVVAGVAPSVAAAAAAAAATAAASAAAAAAAFTLTESGTTVTLSGSSTDAFAHTLGTTTATRALVTVAPSSGTLQATDAIFNGSGYAGSLAITLSVATLDAAVTTGTSATNTIVATVLNDAKTLTLHGTTAATVTLVAGDVTSDSTGNITVTATTGTNLIITGSGNDIITGGTGADEMTGGTGNDVYIFTANADADKIAEGASIGTDVIYVNGSGLDMSALLVNTTIGGAAALIKTTTGIEGILLKATTTTTFTSTQLDTSTVVINKDAAGVTTLAVTAAVATSGIDLSGLVVTAGPALGGVTPVAFGATDIVTITGGTGVNAIKAMATATNVITSAGGQDTITCASGIDKIVVNSASNANADTIGSFTVGTDILQFSVTGLGLNAADYAAGAVTVVAKAAAEALGAGAWNNHILVDSAANILLTIQTTANTGGLLAVASDTGAIYFDANGNFTADSVIVGTVTGGGAFAASSLAIIA